MSALGQKQTYAVQIAMSALPPIATAKAEFPRKHVRFTPESGHVRRTRPCPLWANSGHMLLPERAGLQWRKSVAQWNVGNHHQTVERLVQF